MPWPQANSMLDAAVVYGQRMNSRGGYLPDLSTGVIDAVLGIATAAPRLGGACSVNLWCLGGAISQDAAEEAMAFSREGATWLCEVVGGWDSPEQDDEYDEWASAARTSLERFLLPNTYTNLSDDLGLEWRLNAYGSADKQQRLREAKQTWDPENLLRRNKNIPPNR